MTSRALDPNLDQNPYKLNSEHPEAKTQAGFRRREGKPPAEPMIMIIQRLLKDGVPYQTEYGGSSKGLARDYNSWVISRNSD